ncbi:S-adenosylmethionine:tRNA ribosyltransferase-isomerase [Penaeicola halotolerans]|uniref:S-adenosylmethionine:tRNA ribosyltransferase-isomerase n=1 Tax=Penaeicola halotolerans TaxID=2793196 RepID=UPI001CF87403|nr:S-adenosylmethionine:tRNA ribosyltransferase-isomerase [Penaeicola halotolerans]
MDTNRLSIPTIDLSDYEYILPDEYVAKFPLADRSASKLLHYKEGKITHRQFTDITNLVPKDSLLFFNNTKVIPARLSFQRSTGAHIEIFLLQPISPSTVITTAMLATKESSWKCMIGNSKKWKDQEILQGEVLVSGQVVKISAELIDRTNGQVKLTWSPEETKFVDLIEAAGEVPLPPYLKRKATADDKPRYQTVYSKHEGAVAAPTAGLHFTPEILTKLADQGCQLDYLTLHVSAGTFQPIKSETVVEHPMHAEQILINRANIVNIIQHEGPIIPVGTTSMRTLESSYWYGVKLLKDKVDKNFKISKLYPYENRNERLPSRSEAFQAILDHMDSLNQDQLLGETEIFIFPGYQFQVCDAIVTNFHQPGSTLILLIAAFVGKDWQEIYQSALSEKYRFLSYGDSSLLWRKQSNK